MTGRPPGAPSLPPLVPRLVSRLVACAVLCVLLSSCGGPPPSLPPVDIVVEKELGELREGIIDPDRPDVAHRLEERMETHGIDALGVALILDGELRWVRAWGDADEETPWPAGDLRRPLETVLAIRSESREDAPETLETAIFGPLEMEHSRIDGGELFATAGDLARFVIDLQKAHAGKPARRLDQEQARSLLGTGGEEAPATGTSAATGLVLGGTGHARRFESVADFGDHHHRLVGFVHSGHGAVVLVRGDAPGEMAEEMLAGLAELYDWPGLRAR